MPAPRFTDSTCKAKREGLWDVKCRQHGTDGTDGQMDRQMCAWVTVQDPKPFSSCLNLDRLLPFFGSNFPFLRGTRGSFFPSLSFPQENKLCNIFQLGKHQGSWPRLTQASRSITNEVLDRAPYLKWLPPSG